eukprot:9262190-Heterocapsa_arctica.AAC.1
MPARRINWAAAPPARAPRVTLQVRAPARVLCRGRTACSAHQAFPDLSGLLAPLGSCHDPFGQR